METYAYFCEYFMSDYNLLVSVRILTLLQMQFFSQIGLCLNPFVLACFTKSESTTFREVIVC